MTLGTIEEKMSYGTVSPEIERARAHDIEMKSSPHSVLRLSFPDPWVAFMPMKLHVRSQRRPAQHAVQIANQFATSRLQVLARQWGISIE